MAVALAPWSEHDEPLLHVLLGDPAMMEHLGGPESPDRIGARHRRYLASPADEPQFKVLEGDLPVGWVGYWRRRWRGADVYEMGWSIAPAAQGRGLASRAAGLAVAHARDHGTLTAVHAFPMPGNAASNAVCRKAGFTLLGETGFDYPPGTAIRVNDWCSELS